MTTFTPRMRHVCARLEFADLLDSPLQRGVFSGIIIDSLGGLSDRVFHCEHVFILLSSLTARFATRVLIRQDQQPKRNGFVIPGE